MFERFTERARQTVVFAQQNARDLKHQQISTGDALLGVLQEEEGLAAKTLRALGLTYETVLTEVQKLQPPEGDGPDPKTQVEFTHGTKKAYELALREALSLGHNYIGTEHILLGLIRIYEGAHATVLEGAGLDSEKIRNEIIRVLSGPAGRRPALPVFWVWHTNGPATQIHAENVEAAARKYAEQFPANREIYVAEAPHRFRVSLSVDMSDAA